MVHPLELTPSPLDVISGTEGDGLDSAGHIDRSGCYKDTTVDQEEVRHVVGPTPGINHRPARVGTGARCPHQVPTANFGYAIDSYLACAGGLKNLSRPSHAVIEHLTGVVTYPVRSFGRWNIVAVCQDRIDGDRVVLFRQILR